MKQSRASQFLAKGFTKMPDFHRVLLAHPRWR
jgi:hypothetical protein